MLAKCTSYPLFVDVPGHIPADHRDHVVSSDPLLHLYDHTVGGQRICQPTCEKEDQGSHSYRLGYCKLTDKCCTICLVWGNWLEMRINSF